MGRDRSNEFIDAHNINEAKKLNYFLAILWPQRDFFMKYSFIKVMLSVSATDARGLVVHQERLNASASNRQKGKPTPSVFGCETTHSQIV